jgi:hypothetical protein
MDAETFKSWFLINFDDSPQRNVVIGVTVCIFGTGCSLLGLDISDEPNSISENAPQILAIKGGAQAAGGIVQAIWNYFDSRGEADVLTNEASADDAQDGETGEEYLTRNLEDAFDDV